MFTETSSRNATALGIVALLAWSSVAALTRQLTKGVGPLFLVGISSSCAGLLLFLLVRLGGRAGPGVGALWRNAPGLLLGAGLTFLLYFLGYPLAIALASSDRVAVQLGLVNYLWPALTLLLAPFVLPAEGRARWGLLLLGCGAGVGGAVLAIAPAGGAGLLAAVRGDRWPFLVMLLAALAWALHTLVMKRLGAGGAPLALFQGVVGVTGLVLGYLRGETLSLAAGGGWALAYYSIIPVTLGYALWERGICHGDLRLLTALAYLLPVASTLCSCWLLAVPLRYEFLLGSLLVMAGACISRSANGVTTEENGSC